MPPSSARDRASVPSAAALSRRSARYRFVFPEPFAPTTTVTGVSERRSERIERYPSTHSSRTAIARTLRWVRLADEKCRRAASNEVKPAWIEAHGRLQCLHQVLYMSMSVDGYIAGPNDEPSN